MNREKIWKLTGLFFAGMVLFTLLSRAAYQQGTAVVSTAAPTGGTIAHNVRFTGKTTQNQEQAITTLPGLRVSGVQVNEGEQVAQGDVLFTLDIPYLEETILSQKQEMEKQKLSVQDAWSQNAASQKRRANEQARAQESYYASISQAETALDRAARELDRAEAALEDFYNGVSVDQALEEELILASQEAEEHCRQAQADLESLQREAEEAVRQAQSEAQAQEEPPEPGELEAIAQAVRDDYAQPLADAQWAVEAARQNLEAAKAELQDHRQNQQGASLSEQDLLDALERARDNYDDALDGLDNAQVSGNRSVATANLPEGSNHSAQIGQITYDQMALTLEKLEALLEAEGKILSPVDGVVTRCAVQTGEKTTDTTAMLLADLSQGCKFTGLLTEEQNKYIGVGDKVTLRAESNGKLYKDLPVTAIAAGEDGAYRLTVQLPNNTLALGASAELQFTRKTQAYPCCVPLSALHLDERNQPYVLVVEEAATVLGKQLQARKVSVTVLDQNETMAALEVGSVNAEQQIVVGSDRPVDSGSRVRVS